MDYQNSVQFEDAILGCHSDGSRLHEIFLGQSAHFDRDISRLIKNASAPHPDTPIGALLYWGVRRELERRGVDAKDLIVLSTINTIADARLWGDALIYLPSAHQYPVTLDLFNIREVDVLALRNFWIMTSIRSLYSLWDIQTDLFQYKKGLSAWIAKNQSRENVSVYFLPTMLEGSTHSLPEHVKGVPFIDFRQYSDYGRPENHVILTPYHVATRERRKEFAKMVAEYLVRVSGQNMAQQSQ